LPEYFGFEGVGVLVRDMKTDTLFSINEIERNPDDLSPKGQVIND
jgi:hypothetical protein